MQILEVGGAEGLEVLEVNVLAVTGFWGVREMEHLGQLLGGWSIRCQRLFWLWGCLRPGGNYRNSWGAMGQHLGGYRVVLDAG